MPESLDFALIKRLREVLDSRPPTEAELRSLTEQAEAWALTLNGQVESSERRIRTDRLGNPPRGAIVFWDWWGWVVWPDGISRFANYGHVAISNGDGSVVSTVTWEGARTIDPHVPLGFFAAQRMLGWVPPLR